MVFAVEESYFNIALPLENVTIMITSGLNTQNLVRIIFSIRNHRNSILSSNPDSVNVFEKANILFLGIVV